MQFIKKNNLSHFVRVLLVFLYCVHSFMLILLCSFFYAHSFMLRIELWGLMVTPLYYIYLIMCEKHFNFFFDMFYFFTMQSIRYTMQSIRYTIIFIYNWFMV
jgi:hypothetical protein